MERRRDRIDKPSGGTRPKFPHGGSGSGSLVGQPVSNSNSTLIDEGC